MLKSQVDLENRIVHIADSKILAGTGDMAMTELAYDAFKARIHQTPDSDCLFPTPSPRAMKN